MTLRGMQMRMRTRTRTRSSAGERWTIERGAAGMITPRSETAKARQHEYPAWASLITGLRLQPRARRPEHQHPVHTQWHPLHQRDTPLQSPCPFPFLSLTLRNLHAWVAFSGVAFCLVLLLFFSFLHAIPLAQSLTLALARKTVPTLIWNFLFGRKGKQRIGKGAGFWRFSFFFFWLFLAFDGYLWGTVVCGMVRYGSLWCGERVRELSGWRVEADSLQME